MVKSDLSQGCKDQSSSPVTSWQIDGETVTDFIFLSSKITADGDCSHEIKKYLLPKRKTMTNPDGVLKSRDITLLGQQPITPLDKEIKPVNLKGNQP